VEGKNLMETSPHFCENCGQPLAQAAKFCGACGQPVKPLPDIQPAIAPPLATYPPAQPPQAEFYAPQPLTPPPADYPPAQPPQAEFYTPQPLPPPQAGYPPFQPPQAEFFAAQPLTPPPADYPSAQPPQAEFYTPQPLPPPQAGYPPFQPPQAEFFTPQPPPQAGYFPPQPGNFDPSQAAPPPAYPYLQQSPQPAPTPGPAFVDEHIYGVISGASRKRGFLGMNADNYTLVVTNQRILFATLTKEIMQQQVELAREAAKAQGKGLLSQWGAQLTTNVGQHYYQMDPQAILAEHPANFFYLNSQIRSVHIRRYADDETFKVEYTMELDTVTGKVKLNFSLLNENEVRNLLSQTLGPIVR
jgi:hypothetical protein